MANQDRDLSRVSSMEKNQHKQGRASGGHVPTMKLKGDTAAMSGGINRATKPKFTNSRNY